MTRIDDDNVSSCSPPRPGTRAGERIAYQRLWLRMEAREWRTLAIVPCEEGMSSYGVATLLAAVGVHHGESIDLFDLRDIRMNRVAHVIEAAGGYINRGERVIFATRSIVENMATVPLARSTDGVVLCASIGSTSIRLVMETIDQIGRDRMLGSILIREAREPARLPSLTTLQRRLEARWSRV